MDFSIKRRRFGNCKCYSVLLFAFLFIMLSTIYQNSYATNLTTAEEDSLRVGLVLSGGGALGLAHIGIIQAIEEAGLRIDYITGTSMGGLVGAFYSIGYTTEQMLDIVLSNDFNELFIERKDRRYISNYEKLIDERTIASFPISDQGIDLPAGIITGQNIYTFLSNLTWPTHGLEDFNKLPIPFAAIGTDLETGNAKVFNSGYLPDALRATISIPSIFTPHEIDGKLYVDGGLIRNLPVQDAIDMGANYTIAVHVGSPLMPKDSLNTLSSVLTQTMLFRVLDNVAIQKELADYYIDVVELNAYSPADFRNTDKFVEIGQKAGQDHIEKFREIAAMQSRPPPIRPGIGSLGSLPINDISINGNTIYDNDFIMGLLEFEPGASLSPEMIEEKISKLYSSQFIDLVTYRIQPSNEYFYTLQINVVENIRDEFNIGLRYESPTKASILTEGTFHGLLHRGSFTRGELRLGDRMNIKVDHNYYGPLESRFAVLMTLEYLSEDVEWFFEGKRNSRFNYVVRRGEISFANYFSTNNLIALGARKDFTNHSNIINTNGILSSDQDYHAIFLRFMRDKFNRKSYPTKGVRTIFESYVSDDFLLSQINFTSTTLYYSGWFELTDYLSLNNTLWGSYTTGRDLPWEYWNSPNRFEPYYNMIRFGGAERYEIASRNVQMISLGLQAEPFNKRFIGFDFFAARFLNNFNLKLTENDIDLGFSMTVGAQTILGPLKLIFSHSSFSGLRSELQIGYQF